MTKKKVTKKVPKAKKKAVVPGTGDDTPIIIDDGGSTQVKQRDQKLAFNKDGVAQFNQALTGVEVLQLSYDGDLTEKTYGPASFSVFTGASTPSLDVKMKGNITELTFRDGKPDEHHDPKKAKQYKYVGKDHGDMSKIDIDNALTFDDKAYNMIRLLLK